MNVDAQINAVSRSLAVRESDSGPVKVLSIAQTFPTTQADLWDAVTNLERIPKWFLPISGNLELGGTYQFEGNAGGTIETCDAPNSFRATWEFGGQVSWIEVRITEVGATHARFAMDHVATVPDEMWAMYGPSAVGIGWDSGLLGLALYLTTPGERPADPMAWMMSDEGKQFSRLSANGWRDAQVALGEDPEAAQQAADATFTLYTTMPE